MSLLKSPPAARKSADAGVATVSKPSSSSSSSSASSRGESFAIRQALELIEKAVPAAQVVVVTTLPRGSLQLAQPQRLSEGLLKAYAREFHLEDRLTWQAILSQKPVSGADVFDSESKFVADYLQPNGLAFAAAAPLQAPIVEGYPGAVHVYRAAEQGEFSADDLRRLAHAARQVDELVEKARHGRKGHGGASITLTPRPAGRVFVFDEAGAQRMTVGEFASFDQQLRESMVEEARARLEKLDGQLVAGDRVQLADSRGDLWTFRAVSYGSYPAMGEGRFVVFCLQPGCAEWAAVRPGDFQADPELARLIPALKFMSQEYSRGPGLGEIARQVQLSPFHFHRRFAELLGLTPKHYLLECQITEAKAQLVARKKELSQIATDCGFAHQSHFTSRFKQATGLTPTRWRRLATETNRD